MWTYQATAGNHDFAVYEESTGRDVALVRDFNEGHARLIAAAPELLATLQRLVALNNCNYDRGLDDYRQAMQAANDAIAKAETR